MRVLHIISCLVKADGHSLFCMRLAGRLHAQGHAQTIFTLPSGEDELPDPQGLVHHADGRLLRFFNVSLPLGLERQIAALALFFKPDVVHLHGGWHPVLFFGARVARRMGIPLLLSLHGSLRPAVVEGDRRLKKRLAWHLYQRRLVPMSSLIHVSTEAEKEDLVRLGFDKPTVVVPNGVDFENFSRKDAKAQSDGAISRESASSVIEPWNLGTSAVRRDGPLEPLRLRTVLYLGRLHPLKGLDLLISAWAEVRSALMRDCESALVGKKNVGEVSRQDAKTQSDGATSRESTLGRERISNGMKPGNLGTSAKRDGTLEPLYPVTIGWQLVIAGPDEQGTLKSLEDQVKRLGLVSCVTFTGPLYGEEKKKVLQRADLFVLPTRSDNFGIAVAEALASGVPVITTKGAPWQELLGQEGSNALRAGSNVPSESINVQGDSQVGPGSSFILHPSSFAVNGRCGWWVDIGAEPLAAALKEAMSLTDEERRIMGENGRRLVESKYRWETVAEKMAAVYSGFKRG